MTRGHPLGVLVGTVVVAAFVVSLIAGPAEPLPDIALDSTLLFHLERCVALVLIVLVLFRVVERAWAGQLPIEFTTSGVKYAVQEVRDNTQVALQALTEEARRARHERADVRSRLEALEGRE